MLHSKIAKEQKWPKRHHLFGISQRGSDLAVFELMNCDIVLVATSSVWRLRYLYGIAVMKRKEVHTALHTQTSVISLVKSANKPLTRGYDMRN
jgi:hypothetical protein